MIVGSNVGSARTVYQRSVSSLFSLWSARCSPLLWMSTQFQFHYWLAIEPRIRTFSPVTDESFLTGPDWLWSIFAGERSQYYPLLWLPLPHPILSMVNGWQEEDDWQEKRNRTQTALTEKTKKRLRWAAELSFAISLQWNICKQISLERASATPHLYIYKVIGMGIQFKSRLRVAPILLSSSY